MRDRESGEQLLAMARGRAIKETRKKREKSRITQPTLVVCSDGLSFLNSIKEGRQYSIDEPTLCGHQ